jgi:hypothetical protein
LKAATAAAAASSDGKDVAKSFADIFVWGIATRG